MSGHAPFFFVDPPALDGADLVLEGDDARHLAVVRRASPGDLVRVSDGHGRIVDACLTSVQPSLVAAEIVAGTRAPVPARRVEILQGLAKGDKVDTVIRQLVELGVDGIGVFESGRSVARWDPPRRAAASARWAAVAREAAKQSHRAWLPTVTGPLSLDEAAAAVPSGGGALGLVAHPGARRRLSEAVAASGRPDRISAVIGPEGGLSEGEVAAFGGAGAVPVSLGEQILRTETAAVAIATLLLQHTGRLG